MVSIAEQKAAHATTTSQSEVIAFVIMAK